MSYLLISIQVYDVEVDKKDSTDVLQYRFLSQIPDDSTFRIDAYTGQIYTTRDLSGVISSPYTLEVEVSDNTYAVTGTLTVIIINMNTPPVFLNLPPNALDRPCNIPEDVTALGIVYTVCTSQYKIKSQNTKIHVFYMLHIYILY